MKIKSLILVLAMLAGISMSAQKAASDEELRKQIKDAVMKVYDEELDKSPNDYSLLFARANQHYYNGDMDKAMSDVNRVLELLPAKEKELNFDSRMLRARINDATGALDAEVADLKAAMELNPQSLACVDLLGKVAYKMNDLDAAEKNFQTILRDNQMNYDALYWMGKVEARRGNNDKAAEYVDRAVSLFPAESQVYLNRSDVLIMLNQPEPAAQDLISAISVGDDDGKALRALVEMSDTHYDDVMKTLDFSISKAPRVGMFHYIKASIAMGHFHYAQALSSFNSIISNRLYETSGIYQNAAKCQFELTQYAEALANVNKALAADENNWEGFLLKGKILMAQGADSYADAQTAFNQAAMLNPESLQVMIAKAHLLLLQRKDDDAVKILNTAIMTNPESSEALLLRGWTNKYRLRKDDLAKRDFENVLLNGSDMHQLRGFALHEVGRDDEARQWAKDIIQAGILPGGEAYYYAAALLSDIGDSDAAYQYMESCLANGFGSLYEVKVNENPYVNLKLVRRHPYFNELVERFAANFR
ncbi:MAG: tetratricopeptide repeat protein [Muribaculaceae bacterium]|nr:tetratricopeptide repeat protein [Muribaculaceae bacterium]